MTPTLSVHRDRSLLRPDVENRRSLRVEVGAAAAQEARPPHPVELGLALDCSGSMMMEDKLGLTLQAAASLLRRLRPIDRVAIVTFSASAQVVVPSTPATPEAVERAIRVLSDIQADGNTNLFGGWELARRELRQEPGVQSRLLVLSDGIANSGETNPRVIASAVTDARERGVRTSTLGVGADFEETLMSAISRSGGGNAWFADVPRRIGELVAVELGEALDVVHHSVRLVVDAPAGCVVRCLNRFDTQREGGRTVIDLGAMVSKQLLELAVELRIAPDQQGRRVEVRLHLEVDGKSTAPSTAEFTVATNAENDRMLRDPHVVRVVARALAASARLESLEFNRQGEFRRAREVLRSLAERISRWSQGNDELEGLALELEHDAEALSERRSSMELKQRHYSSEAVSRSREPSGRRR